MSAGPRQAPAGIAHAGASQTRVVLQILLIIVRRGIHLHPLAVILAVLAGAELDGVAGMFLSVPTLAVATVVYRHWLEWRSGDGQVNVLRSTGTG